MATKRNLFKHLPLIIAGFAMGIGVFVNKTSVSKYENRTSVNAADYYASITDSMSGDTLLSNLKSIINNSSVSVSYDWSRYEAADQDPNNSSNIITVYARTSLAKTAHVSNNVGWNREHTFPQSKLENNQSKNDNHIVYASDYSVNSARSNLKMGVVSSGNTIEDSYGHSTTCKKTNDLFDPNNLARGIVARSTMYAAAMYEFDPLDNFESIATMLKWHLDYPVTSQDVQRNNTVYSNQHNKNPFVDHPEYACRIWGNTNSATQSICGSSVGESGNENDDDYTLVTNISSLANDDRVVLSTNQSGSNVEGVTGYDGGNDATVSTNSNEWMQYIVKNKSSNGFNLLDSSTNTYIAEPTGNHFKYNSNPGLISVTEDGKFVSNNRYLCKNSTFYRCYTSVNSSYIPFYIYKVNSSSSTKTLSSISVSTAPNKTAYTAGEYFDPTGLVINRTYSDSTSDTYTYANHSNEFTFSPPTSTPLTVSNTSVSITYNSKVCNQPITVSAPVITSISASVSKTYYVGETISISDITVKDNNNNNVSNFTFSNDGYQFTYEDAASGGALTNKTFTNAITGGGKTCSLSVQVQRKAYKTVDIVTDIIDASDLSATSTSYTNFSNVSKASGAKYAGNSAKNSNNIQLRSKDSSGIVSTVSGGAISSVKINVANGDKVIDVYGSNSAYSSSADLYDSSKRGTKIGYVSTTGTVTFSSEFSFIGIRANDGAVYISSIEINYGLETAENVSNYIMYSDTAGQCTSKLAIAISYYKNLSSNQKTLFQESNNYIILNAKNRLDAWATNQGKTINYSNGTMSNSERLFDLSNNGSDNILFVIVISMSSCLFVSIFLWSKKRKTNL